MGVVFVGGNLALDFVGTLNEREHARVEQLRVPADLGRWVVDAGLLDAAPEVDAADLIRAIALRESLYRMVQSLIGGTAVRRGDLDAVNATAAGAPPTVRVTRAGRRVRSGTVDQALSAVARDALELFDRRDGAQLKWCADEACTHPFLDTSRGHRRRWCDMAACGGRAKVAAYRARRSAAGPRAPA